MTIKFSNIESINSTAVPKLFVVVWDIECGSKRGPGYFPSGEEFDDYIYMIQFDVFLYNQPKPLKHYNITSIPINTQLFFEKYGQKISCSIDDFIFIQTNSEEEILLEFARLNQCCTFWLSIAFFGLSMSKIVQTS